MHRRAVPHQHQAARACPPPMLQKRAHVVGVDRVRLAVKRECALRRDGADGRQMIPGPPLVQAGGVPHRRIRAGDTGPGLHAGFISEEEALRLGLRPLLRAGQVAACPRVMAASARCRARRAGVWGLQRRTWPKRPIGRGWEETPHASCITAARRQAPGAGACPPLADRSLADAQGFGDRARRPAFGLELPGLQPPGCFPIRG